MLSSSLICWLFAAEEIFFFSLRAKRQLFVKGGLQNLPNGSIQRMQQDAGNCCVPRARLLGALLELSRGLLHVFLGNS